MLSFFLLRSLLSKLYLTTLQLPRRAMILERNATDGRTFGTERMAYWLRLGRVGIMTTDYGSTHDGRKEIDLFVLSC
jgi:hypothetical protein